MDNNPVDWDKINKVKVRYGFALELFKKGEHLTDTRIGRIEEFVSYVMLGPSYKSEQSGFLISEDECKLMLQDKNVSAEDYVKATIHLEIRSLKNNKIDEILTQLDSGRINVDNLDECVKRIAELKKE